MTVAQLRLRGVDVDDSEPDRWRVQPGPVRAVDVVVEPDLSNAAPFLAAALVTGGSVTVRDWPRSTTQAGDALREILDADGGRGHAHRRRADRDRHRRDPRPRLRPARRRRADARGGRAVRPGRLARRTCAASPTSAATRPTGWPPSPPSSTAWAATSPRPTTGWPSGRRRCAGGRFRTYADHRMAHAGVILGLAASRACSWRTSPPRPRRSPASPRRGRACSDARPGYDELRRRPVRPPPSAHPPPDQGPAEPTTTRSRVCGHRRPGAADLPGRGPTVTAMKSRPLGRKGVVVGDRVRIVGRRVG